MMTKEKFSQKVTIVSTKEYTYKTQPKNRNRNIINHDLYSALWDAANLVIILNLAEKNAAKTESNYFNVARKSSDTQAHNLSLNRL